MSRQFQFRCRCSPLLADAFDALAGPFDQLLPLHPCQSKIHMDDEFTHRGPAIQTDILGLDTETASVEVHEGFRASIMERPSWSMRVIKRRSPSRTY